MLYIGLLSVLVTLSSDRIEFLVEHSSLSTTMIYIQGQASEWALLRRHSDEDFFGVQICGAYPDTVARTVELIEQHCSVDFIDINMGCPIDIVCNKGAGSMLLTKPMRMKSIVESSTTAVDTPLTIKVNCIFLLIL